MSEYDVIVIGAGPAGLAAAISAASYGLTPLILEKNVPGGNASEIPSFEQFPGHREGTAGSDLIEDLVRRSQQAGVEIKLFEGAAEIQPGSGEQVVTTDSDSYRSRTLILATGCSHELLGIPGETELRGRGVSYCAVCDGMFFKDKRVVVVGCDRRAAEVAAYLAGLASEVTAVCPGRPHPALANGPAGGDSDDEVESATDNSTASAAGRISVIEQVELKEIRGEENVESVLIADRVTGHTREVETEGVFFQLEDRPNSDIAKSAGVQLDDQGYVITDNHGRTNRDGIYAIGDVTASGLKMVVAALAQAAAAATDIFHSLAERQ